MVVSQTARSQSSSAPTITPEHTLRCINDDRPSDRADVLLMPHDESDEEDDTPSPVYHSDLNSDNESVLTMTNFGPVEFERLWTWCATPSP